MADNKFVTFFALVVLFSGASALLNISGVFLLYLAGLYSIPFDPSAVIGAWIAGALIGVATYLQCEL